MQKRLESELFFILKHFLDIHVPVDFHTQKPRGFAYIEYEDVNDAITAREALQALVINGKEISVQYAFGDRKSWF